MVTSAVVDVQDISEKRGDNPCSGRSADTDSGGPTWDAAWEAAGGAGGPGRWQAALVALLCLANLLTAASISEYIFVTASVPHRCRIPECGETSKDVTFNPEWILNAIPEGPSGLAQCERYAAAGSGSDNSSAARCPAGLFHRDNLTACSDLVYGSTRSLVYDFDLGCQEWPRALAGALSDRFGRKFALVFAIVNTGIFGVLKAFSVSYAMYLALCVLHSTFSIGLTSTIIVIISESFTRRQRVGATILVSTAVSLSQTGLGLEAMFIQNWRTLLLAIHIPTFVLISYYWIIPDSIRWLIQKQKYKEAENEIKFMARMNKIKIGEKLMSVLLKPQRESDKIKELSTGDIFRAARRSRPLATRALVAPAWWAACSLVYFGLSINSTSLSADSHLNYILVSLVQIPGFCAFGYFLNKFGRKPTMLFGFLFCAVCNLAFAFMSKEATAARLAVFLLGKFAISGVFSSLTLYASELFPTACRHRLLALSAAGGRLGSVVAPLTPALMQYWAGAPSAMFAAASLASAALALPMPETRGRRLPDTLADIDDHTP